MSKPKNKSNVASDVMVKIKTGDVKMRPKYYFILGSAILGIGLGMLLVISIFTVSIISFHLRFHGSLDFLHFGSMGIRPFWANFPWIFVIVAVIAVAAGIKLVKRYDFSYKKSLVGIAIGIITLVLTIGGAVVKVVYEQPEFLPTPLKPLYDQKFVGDQWLTGEITQLDQGEIVVVTPDGESLDVRLTDQTIMPMHKELSPGDWVRVVGENKAGYFEAVGIRGGGPGQRQMIKGINNGYMRHQPPAEN